MQLLHFFLRVEQEQKLEETTVKEETTALFSLSPHLVILDRLEYHSNIWFNCHKSDSVKLHKLAVHEHSTNSNDYGGIYTCRDITGENITYGSFYQFWYVHIVWHSFFHSLTAQPISCIRLLSASLILSNRSLDRL